MRAEAGALSAVPGCGSTVPYAVTPCRNVAREIFPTWTATSVSPFARGLSWWRGTPLCHSAYKPNPTAARMHNLTSGVIFMAGYVNDRASYKKAVVRPESPQNTFVHHAILPVASDRKGGQRDGRHFHFAPRSSNSLAISLLPCSTASPSAVSPSESFALRFAFLFSSNSTISFLPRMTA